MNNITAIKTPTVSDPRAYNKSQLQLIKNTVARDCNDDEFDMFMEICRRQGLDPFRRQIYAFVFGKNDDSKRRFATVTGIDGYRAIAKRTGTYRPSEDEPEIEYDEKLICPLSNPKGIVKATVIVYQFGPDRQWYPVKGVARWEEFAPLEDAEFDWVPTGELKPDGKPKHKKVNKGGKRKLAKDNWANMPHVMIAKCAEAQALRKGWPEEFGGIYTQDEMDHVIIDMTASEEVRQYEEDERMRKIGATSSVPLVFNFMEGIEFIPFGQVADRVLEHVRSLETSTEIQMWQEANTKGLQMFWARHKSDALELKKAIESLIETKPQFQTAE
ncbi:MAG: phage recombination protein Bet [Micavibrio aeruginosavorus]|uniref:Phage recombination protein Bet n=1 Tax=Micavibrio aeruginosavorus TaxID=349221 RepID=A0A2W5PI90_9BACT|nr:MAG: phage recombination protein Bet [Micavibrio aeruginosavorus]